MLKHRIDGHGEIGRAWIDQHDGGDSRRAGRLRRQLRQADERDRPAALKGQENGQDSEALDWSSSEMSQALNPGADGARTRSPVDRRSEAAA